MARVLVVEDEPNIAGIIEFKLRREGHQVSCAPGAEAASTLLSTFEPELVVLDLGVGADARAIVMGQADRCPVLVLTELHDGEAPGRALRDGAAATLQKPFKPTVLARLVGQLVDRPPAPR